MARLTPKAHPFDLRVHADRLSQMISAFGTTSVESRQVARRLKTLLPSRFKEIKRELMAEARSAGHAERLTLIDERYCKHINEFLEMNHAALEARVQYETHTMLLNARRSLRAFNARQPIHRS